MQTDRPQTHCIGHIADFQNPLSADQHRLVRRCSARRTDQPHAVTTVSGVEPNVSGQRYRRGFRPVVDGQTVRAGCRQDVQNHIQVGRRRHKEPVRCSVNDHFQRPGIDLHKNLVVEIGGRLDPVVPVDGDRHIDVGNSTEDARAGIQRQRVRPAAAINVPIQSHVVIERECIIAGTAGKTLDLRKPGPGRSWRIQQPIQARDIKQIPGIVSGDNELCSRFRPDQLVDTDTAIEDTGQLSAVLHGDRIVAATQIDVFDRRKCRRHGVDDRVAGVHPGQRRRVGVVAQLQGVRRVRAAADHSTQGCRGAGESERVQGVTTNEIGNTIETGHAGIKHAAVRACDAVDRGGVTAIDCVACLTAAGNHADQCCTGTQRERVVFRPTTETGRHGRTRHQIESIVAGITRNDTCDL